MWSKSYESPIHFDLPPDQRPLDAVEVEIGPKLRGSPIPQRAVGAGAIVILPPSLHDSADVGQAEESALVEALVPPAVEALADRLLNRLARLDEAEPDRTFARGDKMNAA